jgi:hypothetical protein
MPILLLLEKIRLKLMARFHERFAYFENWTSYTISHIRKVLNISVEKNKEHEKYCR